MVKIRGPKDNVDKCDKHLKKMLKEINENSFVLQVPINKQYHRYLHSGICLSEGQAFFSSV